MSSAALDSRYFAKHLAQEVEPVFVSYYKIQNGKSPTLIELKQYLAAQAIENLVDVLKNSDSIVFKSMSAKELMTAINLYIRKLRVW